MGMYINTNIASLGAQNNLGSSQAAMQTSLERLSSGLRINSAKDDAAGLSIVTRMTSQIDGMNQATINTNDGISFLQTADSAMTTITDNLQRIRDLSLQAANASNSVSDRQSINNEVQQLKAEIQQVATTTSFNGTPLLDGSIGAMPFQVGANLNNTIIIGTIQNMQLSQLGSSRVGSTVTGTTTVSALNGGDLTLNGVPVGASISGTGIGKEASSAFAIALAINTVTGSSGVTATANTTLTGSAPTNISAIQDFSINGVDVGAVGAGSNAASQGANLAAAIMNVSGQTGITATANASGALTLVAANGQNIEIGLGGTALNSAIAASDRATFLGATGLPSSAVGTETSAAVAAQFNIHGVMIAPSQPAIAASIATTSGVVTLSDPDSNGILIGGISAASAGFTDGLNNQNSTSTIPGIASLNVLTQGAAQNSVTSIDSAILMVNNAQAQIGAYENRFAATLSSIQTGIENLSSSRSLIQDTNFASETGNLTRAGILQQAGTAMLAQANATPNIVMSLLK